MYTTRSTYPYTYTQQGLYKRAIYIYIPSIPFSFLTTLSGAIQKSRHRRSWYSSSLIMLVQPKTDYLNERLMSDMSGSPTTAVEPSNSTRWQNILEGRHYLPHNSPTPMELDLLSIIEGRKRVWFSSGYLNFLFIAIKHEFMFILFSLCLLND